MEKGGGGKLERGEKKPLVQGTLFKKKKKKEKKSQERSPLEGEGVWGEVGGLPWQSNKKEPAKRVCQEKSFFRGGGGQSWEETFWGNRVSDKRENKNTKKGSWEKKFRKRFFERPGRKKKAKGTRTPTTKKRGKTQTKNPKAGIERTK